MTVTYTAQVASCRRFGCFWKLLLRWKGSIYKLLWPNLFVYIMLYSSLSFTYRFLLNENQRTTFEKFSLHCQTYGDLIPVSFVLGFYVSIVIKRWWDQYTSIPWPDSLAVLVSAFLPEQDERSRLMRRTIVRYACLSLAITLRMMCPSVKKRFPTLEHMVEAGFMLVNEKKTFDKLEEKTVHAKYWLPLVWAASVITTARKENRIKNDFTLKALIDEVNKFRSGCGSLLNYDWISVPLVYTQVVSLAVFTYFMASLMGNQYLNPSKGYPTHTIDLVIPIFTLLQFFFYMGWLMVAETLVNPFGEDDDDFEVNWLIDRNLQVSFLIVDETHKNRPALAKDQYWEEVFPTELPYTEAAKQYHMEPFLGSAQAVEVPLHQRGMVLMPISVDTEFSMKTTQILSVLSLKKHNSFTDGLDRSPSKSVLTILRQDICEDYTSLIKNDEEKPEVIEGTKPTINALTIPNKSQAYSFNSISKYNLNDFHEDIFRMSDFSMTESLGKSQDGIKICALSGKEKRNMESDRKILSLDQQENESTAMFQNEQLNVNNIKHNPNNSEKGRHLEDRSPIDKVHFNEASPSKTVVVSNCSHCVKNHWKRDVTDKFIFNKAELLLDYYMAHNRSTASENNSNNQDEQQSSSGHAKYHSVNKLSQVIHSDQQILLEKGTSMKQMPAITLNLAESYDLSEISNKSSDLENMKNVHENNNSE